MNFKDKLIYKLFGAKISYSQCGEDIIIDHVVKNILNISQFKYLDIGTNHPKKANNTYKFYEQNCTGVCVEPNPSLANIIRRERSKDKCLNVGVSLNEEDRADFYVMDTHTLSTFSKNDAEQFEKEGNHKIEKIIQIKLMNINTIIEQNFDTCPDLISIDVEGLNEEIALSFDFSKFRPKIFCLETITYSDNNQGKRLNNVIDYLIQNDYQLYADTNINSIFIDNKHNAKKT
ncbi:MAG: FkbM family methyltransferase [Flavobacteriales bacterium]|nr:FkbM family methyltransferase [Flavobacteriales bacterium]